MLFMPDNSMLHLCNTTYNLLNRTQTIQSFTGLGGFLCVPFGFYFGGQNRLFTPLLPHGNGFPDLPAAIPPSDMVMSGNDKTVARPTLDYA
jgi:hypothetical protein